MIVYSDQTATNLVLDKVGIAATNQRMQAWGFRNTKVYPKTSRDGMTSIDPEATKRFWFGSTTGREMVTLLENLNAGTRCPPAIKQTLLAHLRHRDDRDKFPRFLPADTIPAHKTGSTERVRNDAGILFLPDCAVAICVLTADNEDGRGDADNAGSLLCAKVTREVHAYFHKP